MAWLQSSREQRWCPLRRARLCRWASSDASGAGGAAPPIACSRFHPQRGQACWAVRRPRWPAALPVALRVTASCCPTGCPRCCRGLVTRHLYTGTPFASGPVDGWVAGEPPAAMVFSRTCPSLPLGVQGCVGGGGCSAATCVSSAPPPASPGLLGSLKASLACCSACRPATFGALAASGRSGCRIVEPLQRSSVGSHRINYCSTNI